MITSFGIRDSSIQIFRLITSEHKILMMRQYEVYCVKKIEDTHTYIYSKPSFNECLCQVC